MTPDIHALVGPYVLDAVDDLERAAFERHLRECDACRLETAELREATARLADGVWSVPPPRMRENVMARIATTRQLPPPAPAVAERPVPGSSSRRLRLVAAAAVVVAAAGAGTAVYAVQEQRVRHEQAVAQAARDGEARIRTVLGAPDLVTHEQRLASGGRVTVATSRLYGAGVIVLAADGAPSDGHVYQLWTIRGTGAPASAGVLGEGEAATVRVVEGLTGVSDVGVTVEPAPGSATPTSPLDALVKLT